MNEHPNDLLLPIAEGAVPSSAVAAHLQGCERCRRTLDALAPVDLGMVWQGVAAELDAPRASLLERAAARVGLDPALARLAGTTPSLSAAWLLASLVVLALGMQMASLSVGNASPALVVAPFVAAAAVAFAYGPGVDPAYDVVSVTPVSPLRALLVRLAAVLSVNALIVSVLDLLTGVNPFGLAWLLPMTGAALLAAVVASRFTPVVGAAAGMGTWLLVLAALATFSRRPLATLSSGEAQLVSAAVVALLLAVLLRRAVSGDWVRPGPEAR